MDYAINDPRLAKSVPQILPPNYRLEMQCSHYRNWTLAFNMPLCEELVRAVLFFRDQGAEVFVTVPNMDEVRQDLAAYMVANKIPVFAIAGSNFKEVHHLYRKIAAAGADLYIDTNCILSGYASTMHPDAASSAFAVLETELEGFPSFFQAEDNSFSQVARLSASSVMKDDQLKVPMSFRLFRMIDSFISEYRKFKPKTYAYAWLDEAWRVRR